MLSLSPCSFSGFGWALDDNYNHRQVETSESFLRFPSVQPNNGAGAGAGEDATMVKKINHNASERDRRKKINTLYSSLRSLLPSAADQTKKKLSIAATVSRMLKYIPELEKEVERLVEKKEDVSSRLSSCRELVDNPSHDQNQRRQAFKSSSSSLVLATQLADTQVVIQISTTTTTTSPLLSEVLLYLEENGLLLLDASVFQSFGDRIFYNLHLLQVQGTPKMELEMLRQKLQSFFL